MTNVITAIFLSGRVCKTPHAYQYDYGQRLVLKNLNLPDAYEVHFSNNEFGESKTAIGDADGVAIPDEYFLSGKDIHFWLFLHETDSDGETEYHGIIPVRKRARPTDTEPTPVQQDVITQTIAALNTGVSRAEEAKSAWENMTAEAETLPEGSPASASYHNGVLSIGIPTGATGAPGQDGRDGQDGQPGKDGQDGQDGAPGRDGQDGAPGQDGVSPTVTITDITGGHRITITDVSGTKTFDVMDGETGATGPIGPQGEPGQDAVVDPTLTQTGQAADAKVTGDEISAVKNALNQKIDDVQVNGASVVENGVADIPLAADTSIGVVRAWPSGGTHILNDGRMSIQAAADSNLKAGSSAYQPVVATTQHKATFYGLAKAAGSDEKNSTLPVGTYTEEAKIAIQKMLGIYEAPWELIREDTFTNETEANHVVSVDSDGLPFELTDICVEFWLTTTDGPASFPGGGRINIYYNNSASLETCYIGSINLAQGDYGRGATAVLRQEKGLLIREFSRNNTFGNEVPLYTGNQLTGNHGWMIKNTPTIYFINVEFVKVTGTGNYRIIGKRKWQ